MRFGYCAIALASSLFIGLNGDRAFANQTATWDGTTSNQWHEGNWTLNGTPAQTADTVTPEGHVGGRGGIDWVIGGGAAVEHNHNKFPDDPNGQGDFKPRMDVTPGGSLTIKQGASLSMDSHTDTDGRWTRVGIDITLDNGTLRRTHSGTSDSGGKIIFGYHNELLPNQKINIKVLNGGKIENAGKMIFGEPDLAPDVGHNSGIEVAMTINNGTLDLTGGADYPDYFGLANGELLFFYEYGTDVNTYPVVGPFNEKYSINFTGPGSIIVDNGIYAAAKDSGGAFNPLGGGPDLFTSLTYEALWNLGILQANGQSGLTGATFGTYFTTTGTAGSANYTLTSLVAPPGVAGDYNNNGVVDAADYVLYRNGGPLQNEGTTPGSVTADDYTYWRSRFGSVAGSGAGLGAAAVPEPTTAISCVFGLAVLAFRKRSRR